MEKKTQTAPQQSDFRSEEVSVAKLMEEQEKLLADFFAERENSFEKKPIILVIRGFGMAERMHLINEVRNFIHESVLFDICESGLIMHIYPNHNILITDNSILCNDYMMGSTFDMKSKYGDISLVISFAKQNAKRFEDIYQDYPLISIGKRYFAINEEKEMVLPPFHSFNSFINFEIYDAISKAADIYTVIQLTKWIVLIIQKKWPEWKGFLMKWLDEINK